jgi:hypothetical protein
MSDLGKALPHSLERFKEGSRAGGVAQAIERLLSKPKTLSSNPSATKQKIKGGNGQMKS